MVSLGYQDRKVNQPSLYNHVWLGGGVNHQDKMASLGYHDRKVNQTSLCNYAWLEWDIYFHGWSHFMFPLF